MRCTPTGLDAYSISTVPMTEREKLELIRRIFVQGSKGAVTAEVRACTASFIATLDQKLAALDNDGSSDG
jgi:hypothetical protein